MAAYAGEEPILRQPVHPIIILLCDSIVTVTVVGHSRTIGGRVRSTLTEDVCVVPSSHYNVVGRGRLIETGIRLAGHISGPQSFDVGVDLVPDLEPVLRAVHRVRAEGSESALGPRLNRLPLPFLLLPRELWCCASDIVSCVSFDARLGVQHRVRGARSEVGEVVLVGGSCRVGEFLCGGRRVAPDRYRQGGEEEAQGGGQRRVRSDVREAVGRGRGPVRTQAPSIQCEGDSDADMEVIGERANSTSWR